MCSQSKVNILFGSKETYPQTAANSVNKNPIFPELSCPPLCPQVCCCAELTSVAFFHFFFTVGQKCVSLLLWLIFVLQPLTNQMKKLSCYVMFLRTCSHLQTTCCPLSAGTPFMVSYKLHVRFPSVQTVLGPWTFLLGNPAHLVCGFTCVNSLCFSMPDQPANHLSL